MKKYIFLILIVCFRFLNCKNSENKIVNTIEIKSNNLNFFDFDKVEHYYKDIDAGDILVEMQRLETIDKKSEEHNYLNLIGYDYPKDVNDEKFIDNLIKFKFSKVQIEDKFYNELNKLFSFSNCQDDYGLACAPVYRDILVFYKEEKIVGIAKICFECDKSDVIGAKKDASFFGHCGGYGKLYKILKVKQ